MNCLLAIWLVVACFVMTNNCIPLRMLSMKYPSSTFRGLSSGALESSVNRGAMRAGLKKSKIKKSVTEFEQNKPKASKVNDELNYEQKVPCWKATVMARKMHMNLPRYVGSNTLDQIAYDSYKQIKPNSSSRDICKLGINFRMDKKCKDGSTCSKVRSHNVYLKSPDENDDDE